MGPSAGSGVGRVRIYISAATLTQQPPSPPDSLAYYVFMLDYTAAIKLHTNKL